MSNHPRPDRIIAVGRTVIEVWDGNCVRTTLPDGQQVIAAPEDNDAYRKTARDCGYGADTFRLCVEHETCHALIAEITCLAESPTMRGVAAGRSATPLTDAEEGAVIAIQKFCRAAGIDLLALADCFCCRRRHF